MRLRLIKFFAAVGVLACASSRAEPEITPPAGTWEYWLQHLPRAKRPDHKSVREPLPLWVDCHLSWIADHPELGKTQRWPKGITLRANATRCKGQIEEWVSRDHR